MYLRNISFQSVPDVLARLLPDHELLTIVFDMHTKYSLNMAYMEASEHFRSPS